MRDGGGDILALALDGESLPLRWRRSARARSILIRIGIADDIPVLILPKRASLAEGLAFAAGKADWLRRRLAEKPRRLPFADGAELPLLGRPHRIRHRPEAKRGVWAEGDSIHVSGAAPHLARRLKDWLIREARREIGARARRMAESLDLKPGRIAIRDPKSRWGSCSHRGDLSFSWRLLLAPVFVCDYVIAHEVAHLAQMNHGPRFWALVDRLVPDRKAAEAWLRAEGAGLHRHG